MTATLGKDFDFGTKFPKNENYATKETVSTELWELLQKLMKAEKLNDYFLVVGTALALRIGHRISVDIYLFSTKDFEYDNDT
ncbi:hypothetical protein [Sphingobacterium multivorum]|uniref:hypothetical protein n=1 Tax=Sphingobacterium multivorum TaxID=28454 RepID=UPI003DA61680